MVNESRTFRAVFCAQHRCADAAFERAIFWRGLHRHALPVAFFIRLFAPHFFRDDDELIRQVGIDSSLEDVAADLDHYRYGNRVRHHWLRTGLRLHLDPARVRALARRCLAS